MLNDLQIDIKVILFLWINLKKLYAVQVTYNYINKFFIYLQNFKLFSLCTIILFILMATLHIDL